MADRFPIESARVIEYEKDIDVLSQAIDQHLSYARERKWSRALAWFRNAAFLAGQHLDNFRYAQGHFTQDAVVIPPRFQEIVSPHMVDNHILRIVQANIAELTGMNPYPVNEPASLDPDDIDLAKVGEIIARVLWEKPLRVPPKLRMLIGYLAISGTGAAETYFGELDSFEQRFKTKLQEVPNIISGEMEEEEVETDQLEWIARTGMRMGVWSGFHIDVNPDATDDPDSLTWICRTTFEDATLIRRMYSRKAPGYRPENLKGIQPSDCQNDPLWHWEQIKHLIDSPGGSMPLMLERGSDRSQGEQLRVRLIDTRPNLDHPMGRTIVQAGGQIVYAGPSRSWTKRKPERWTPMRVMRWWTLPGRFWGIPLISPLIPLQKRVNALDTIIRLNRQYLGIGVKLLPKVCNIPEGFIGPVPGQDIPYRVGPRGEKPEPWPFSPLPADVWEERAGCVASMERIGGIASSQLPSSPSALRSGEMLDFSQRMALQAKSAILLDFEAFVGDLTEDILQEVSRNMAGNEDLRRLVSVAARELGDLAIDRFEELDLRDNVRVQIDLRSQMLQTPEAKKEAAGIFLQFAGQTMGPAERAKIAQIMGLDEIEMQTNAQWKRARRMVERILQGNLDIAVPLDGVDDPSLFAEVIRDAMLSERSLVAPMPVKDALEALLEHYTAKLAERTSTLAQAAFSAGSKPEDSASVANPNGEVQNQS